MMKLKSKRLHRTLSKFLGGGDDSSNNDNKERGGTIVREINWELRPGGMLVQKREMEGQNIEKEGFILVRVAAGSRWHDISIQSTSTFGTLACEKACSLA
ncbi:hypothetical protein HanPI659440_Chr07g0273201 [Helianthus annuus]|nr:hypothetical protein HanPI659440_Chr07g0273201 [Helianthus annuus]